MRKMKAGNKLSGKSIRTFIGAEDYNLSRNFYLDLGFHAVTISAQLTYFSMDGFGFYLQDYYVKDGIDNSMIFFEVENLEDALEYIKGLELTEKYGKVRLSAIVRNDWGDEFFLHDPGGVLWHFGSFRK